jgi:peptide/nickel transport system substrate-binding protein
VRLAQRIFRVPLSATAILQVWIGAIYTGYCNPELDKLFDKRSGDFDAEERFRLVWEIDRKLQEDGAKPTFHNRSATCWHPHVKSIVQQVNSIYNNWRMEDSWINK